MSAPVLNHKLLLETPETIADGMGGASQGWVGLGTLWGDVRPRTGRERTDGNVSLSQVPARITVRAAAPGSDARPRAGQRFREGSRIYSILAVSEVAPEGRFLTCDVIEEIAV